MEFSTRAVPGQARSLALPPEERCQAVQVPSCHFATWSQVGQPVKSFNRSEDRHLYRAPDLGL